MDFGIKKKKNTIKPDKSDFSTQKTKPNVSDFANKNKFKPKVTVKDTSGKFSSDAGVKPSVNTFTADTNAAKNTDKDRSDFAGGKKTSKTSKTTKNTKTDKKVKKTTTSKISPRGLAFRAARKANKKVFEFPKGSGKMFTTKLKGEDKKVVKKKNEVTAKTKEKRVRGPKVNVPGKMKGGPPPKKATTKKLSFLDKIMKETRRNFGPGRNKLVSKGTSNIIDNKNFVSDKKKKK